MKNGKVYLYSKCNPPKQEPAWLKYMFFTGVITAFLALMYVLPQLIAQLALYLAEIYGW